MKQSNLFGLLSFVCLIDISPSASLHALVEPHAVAYYRAEYVVAMKAYKTLAEKGCIDAQHFVGSMCQTKGAVCHGTIRWPRNAVSLPPKERGWQRSI